MGNIPHILPYLNLPPTSINIRSAITIQDPRFIQNLSVFHMCYSAHRYTYFQCYKTWATKERFYLPHSCNFGITVATPFKVINTNQTEFIYIPFSLTCKNHLEEHPFGARRSRRRKGNKAIPSRRAHLPRIHLLLVQVLNINCMISVSCANR